MLRKTVFALLIAAYCPTALSHIIKNPNEHSKQLCANNPYEYTCVIVKPGFTWDRLFPDPRKQAIIKKINRMNIKLHPGMILALPNNLEQADPLMFAPFPISIAPFNRTAIIVDLDDYAFAAYDSFGALVYWGPISSGKKWCSDTGRGCSTPTGTFYINRKSGVSCKSSKYPIPTGGAPMPYCMFFHGGYALHASTEVPGYNASHGCVRLFLKDAQWLNENFIKIGKNSTKVIVRP